MPLVSWSPKAELDLQQVVPDPAVRDQLRQVAGQILHDVEEEVTEGAVGGIRWHRGTTHKYAHQLAWFMETEDGPWNYFLFYRRLDDKPGYEVIAVVSIRHIATWWEQASASRDKQPTLADVPLLSSSFRVA